MKLSKRGFLKRLSALLGTGGLLRIVGSAAGESLPGSASGLPRFSGRAVGRAAQDYEIWRRSMAWQASKPERRPELIVQAANVEDVVMAVDFARAKGAKIAVRCSGHSWIHSGIRDGGILLDLARLRGVQIDAAARRATVQPAISGRELMRLLAPHELAFPVAHCGTVALGGYLLGGGQAWNGDAWGGTACFSVEGLEVVTADGDVINVDAQRHADLFWLARGVGPAFPGVITRFDLALYALPRVILCSNYVFPLAQAAAVADWAQECGTELADEVEVLMFMAAAPPGLEGRCGPEGMAYYLAATVFAATEADARAGLRPFAEGSIMSRAVSRDEYAPASFDSLFDWVDRSFVPDRYAADTAFSDQDLSAMVARVAEHFAAAPSRRSMILCEVHPKPRSYPEAAFSMHALSEMICYAVWSKAEDAPRNRTWLRELMELLAPITVGRFISETDLLASPTRAQEAFTPQNWQRIRALQEQYDPHGVFHRYLTG